MTPAAEPHAALPEAVFATPLLRGLDARARRELSAAGKTRALAAGELVYGQGAPSEAFFVVVSGAIALYAARGHERLVVRRARTGESFGEEATVVQRRQSEARAEGPAVVAEIPVHLYRRAAVRSGQADQAERLERTLLRAVARDVLAGTPLAQNLDEAGLDAVLDAVTFHSFARGQVLYRQGDASQSLFFVGDGLIQIQTEEDERTRVRAYLARGDFFGDEELELATARAASAVANGPSTILAIPARIVRALAAEDPELFARLRRVSLGLADRQQAIVGRAAKNATQHVFRDLYRVQVARSLLVIDLDTCVRCGHCAWACGDVYGTSRLVRSGDRVVTAPAVAQRAAAASALSGADGEIHDVFAGLRAGAERALPQNLLLPSSCQHCENPACMVDCPTGAIGKDPGGEVFIREALCTGCGACARACPWDNIQMAPRPPEAPRPEGLAAASLAVKCDLCRTYARGPACVAACPVEAIVRIDPEREWSEVAALLDAKPGASPSAPSATTARSGPIWPLALGATIASAALAVVGTLMHHRGQLAPSRGLGYAAGWASLALAVALVGYAAPKRLVAVWMRLAGRRDPARPRDAEREPARGSLLRPHYAAHLVLGLLLLAGTLLHAKGPLRATNALGGALSLSMWIAGLSGVVLAIFYAALPRVLARVERKALLPEELGQERERLSTELYKGLSGRDELLKAVAEKVVLPYARSPLASLALLFSGRDLRAEQRRLRARVDTALEGRGQARLGGLDELCRIAVELRALPLVRTLSFALRGLLPIHVASFAIALTLLAAHVALDGLGLGRSR